jgi:photosystem II stability/assembly factor-like uncharacterized protein
MTETPTAMPATATPPALNAPVVAGPTLVGIHMLDDTKGWGVGTEAILQTADGGNTWHDVSPPTLSSFGFAVTSEFLDSQHAWVLLPDPDNLQAGILHRTSDGGAHWNVSPVPFGGGSLRFLDPRHGWMMSMLGAGAGSMAVAIHQTEDAGATWVETYHNDPSRPGAGNSLPLGGLKNGISPISMQRAWIGGVIYRPGALYLYETSDGGRSWTSAPASAPTGYEKAELETVGPLFTSPQIAYLPVHLSTRNGVLLAVYVSRDGGASWLVGPAFVPQGGLIDFVSETTGFVWNGSQFFATEDSAQSWTATTPDIDFTDSYGGMDFVNARTGFVLSNRGNGRTLLHKTVDAGRTWDIVGGQR